MRSFLYVLSLSHLILITARIAVSLDTSCSDDQDCFPSGGGNAASANVLGENIVKTTALPTEIATW